MQNFDGASKLVGNTQNRPAVHKNRRKTLKTEQKQWLEARRSLTGTCRRRQNRLATSKTATTDSNDEHRSTFQQPKHQSRDRGLRCRSGSEGPCLGEVTRHKKIYICFFFRWLQLRQPPQIRQNHHRTRQPASQTTKNKQNNLFYFIFSTGRCSGLHKTRTKKKKTAIEIYEGNQQENCSDTMLRFVRGGQYAPRYAINMSKVLLRYKKNDL
jgi:hypothetical protein